MAQNFVRRKGSGRKISKSLIGVFCIFSCSVRLCMYCESAKQCSVQRRKKPEFYPVWEEKKNWNFRKIQYYECSFVGLQGCQVNF